ncbi:MAG: prepilin-type N-terminal cleavage/methylation domain-containing protein [Lentisphaeraceae bacterium]|nr:prepilin-type N-terminal cleavage/methylation domain-containing protein [Lentisphaeraceae bacterium]
MRKFTLIELLVVVAIIGILTSLLLPSLGKAKYMARIAVCASNMNQIGKGVVNYTTDFDGYLPPSGTIHGTKPYSTYLVKTSNSNLNQSFNLGPIYEKGYISEEVIFCPQSSLTSKDKFTYEFYKTGDKIEIPSGDWCIRSSYNFAIANMSTTKRNKLKLQTFESNDILLADHMLGQTGTAHKTYGTGWNVMKLDLGVRFKRSKEVWSRMGNWDWATIDDISDLLVE